MTSVRRLTAILAADVAGYSRLMGADEEGFTATMVRKATIEHRHQIGPRSKDLVVNGKA
jgi:hypothetical protein